MLLQRIAKSRAREEPRYASNFLKILRQVNRGVGPTLSFQNNYV